jgi:hypothetical protein
MEENVLVCVCGYLVHTSVAQGGARDLWEGGTYSLLPPSPLYIIFGNYRTRTSVLSGRRAPTPPRCCCAPCPAPLARSRLSRCAPLPPVTCAACLGKSSLVLVVVLACRRRYWC